MDYKESIYELSNLSNLLELYVIKSSVNNAKLIINYIKCNSQKFFNWISIFSCVCQLDASNNNKHLLSLFLESNHCRKLIEEDDICILFNNNMNYNEILLFIVDKLIKIEEYSLLRHFLQVSKRYNNKVIFKKILFS